MVGPPQRGGARRAVRRDPACPSRNRSPVGDGGGRTDTRIHRPARRDSRAHRASRHRFAVERCPVRRLERHDIRYQRPGRRRRGAIADGWRALLCHSGRRYDMGVHFQCAHRAQHRHRFPAFRRQHHSGTGQSHREGAASADDHRPFTHPDDRARDRHRLPRFGDRALRFRCRRLPRHRAAEWILVMPTGRQRLGRLFRVCDADMGRR